MPETLLIIDDDRSVLRSVARNIEVCTDFQCITASSGREGLSKALEYRPALIILDLMLPDLNGFKVMEALQEAQRTSDIPVLLTTGLANPSGTITTAARKFRAAKCLFKPFTRTELLDSICSILEGKAGPGDERAPSDSSRARKSRVRIFVADDELEFLDLATRLLESKGYRVERAHSGKDVIRRILQSLPDLVILDCQLPGLDGLTICRRLKLEPKTRFVPTLILTGHEQKAARATSICNGADLFRSKPIRIDEFLEDVDALLHRIPYAAEESGKIAVGAFLIDPTRRLIRIQQQEFENVPVKLFDVAYLLVQHRPRVLDVPALMRSLKMGPKRDSEISVLVSRLRALLGPSARLFRTVWRRGYYFDERAALALEGASLEASGAGLRSS